MASSTDPPRHSVRQAPAGRALRTLASSWRLALEAAGKSPLTVRSYTDSAKALAAWLEARGLSCDVSEVGAAELEAFLAAETERTSAASAGVHFRNLRVFWNWLVAEGEHPGPSPMQALTAPVVTRTRTAPLAEAELRALVQACEGTTFEDRRDLAIVRILIDNGMRISSLAELRYDADDPERTDVLLEQRALRIRRAGGEPYLAPVGAKAAAAIDRYLRARSGHPQAGSPYLWLGSRGHRTSRMTTSGIRQMIERRARAAGVPDVHPQRFRRTFADGFLDAGGSVDELIVIGGWSDYNSVKPYLDGRTRGRGRVPHARPTPGDRL